MIRGTKLDVPKWHSLSFTYVNMLKGGHLIGTLIAISNLHPCIIQYVIYILYIMIGECHCIIIVPISFHNNSVITGN